MGVNDKAEEKIYLTAEQTILLIEEVRNNLLKTILGKEKLMHFNTKDIIPRLKNLKQREMENKEIQE